ncbi:hypothetical protein SAMD00019534_001020, partial [Acytostelium subglobosum LB1]|uniref:hypothetical protein n=1 Tax=Acytostelium subglobosum LB1 TaxID=1410327 RepID=UPI000645070D
MKYIDIGVNLTDDMYQGMYHGKQKHQADLPKVLQRSWDNGLDKIIITSGRLSEVQQALNIIKLQQQQGQQQRLFTTIGVHPTRCTEFVDDEQKYIDSLLELYNANKESIVAIGEFGLDYDRLEFCPKDVQLKYFELQFKLVEATGLPLFLHLRNAFGDFMDVIKRHRHTFKYGVVHSFDGTAEEAKQIIEAGLYIGINGCSLKTEDNLKAMATIPSDRLLIETDAPWCDIRRTHASHKYVKTTFESVKKPEKHEIDKCVQSRNEPCHIVNVLEVIAGCRNESIDTLGNIIYETSNQIFFPSSSSTNISTTTTTT